MPEHLFDVVWAFGAWLLSAVGTVGLTGLGVYFEHVGQVEFAAGHTEYAAVHFVLGLLALVWGLYLCGYEVFLPKTRAYLTK
ncbi:hypothetical protein HUG10_13805 [Halorarum halophilum]|uniref:DUF8151 domain-containing protein n=1 Tax=Halorarum halophilum TaxID=2743090 RepID=A0A7D5H1I9_9EURY|nr:hypothetical protein [Halobaculum halophilum]QLG28553.1 hypothetical protein HUG10_13805 [Halobaculum halophilum]